jgi:hypothetical protein
MDKKTADVSPDESDSWVSNQQLSLEWVIDLLQFA